MKRKPVSFKATKREPRKVDISFESSKGKKVSFRATKRTPQIIKLSFGAAN